MTGEGTLDHLLAEIRACRHCADRLPLGPRPVVRAQATARLLIIGQAPGTKVHASGVPWDDASGDRLRDWMALDRARFYDTRHIAIMPMGFCYPGRAANGGDLPPRPECAPLWHDRLRAHLPALALTLLVGGHAQKYYLKAPHGRGKAGSVAATVKAWRTLGPALMPLPHPSWRTQAWAKRYPWFEAEVLPALRARIRALLPERAG